MTVQGLEYSDPLHYTSFGSDTTDGGDELGYSTIEMQWCPPAEVQVRQTDVVRAP